MPIPDNPRISPSAYARMNPDDRAELLIEYLEDLQERICWVGDELERHGYCALCIATDGDQFEHDCTFDRQR